MNMSILTPARSKMAIGVNSAGKFCLTRAFEEIIYSLELLESVKRAVSLREV
jgi:hypothetical protein